MSYKVLISKGQTVSTDTTIPVATTEAGTISTVVDGGGSNLTTLIIGVSTTFITSKIQAQDWLYVASATAGLRIIGQVASVETETSLTLVAAPTEAVSAKAFKSIRPYFKKVNIFPSATTGKISGVAVGTVQRIPYESEDGHVGPIEIDGSTSSFFVVTEY